MATRDLAAPTERGVEREYRTVAKDDETSGAPASLGRVLIVEDDYLVASELAATLADAGLRVVGVAGTADQAIQLARTYRPDLAVVDVRLIGQRDGVDAALVIFNELGIRSIFASAHDDPDTRERAKRAAPIGWLGKPYSPARLITMIRAALSSQPR
jgi:DNA-binding NarL/FixJ family response regulator